MMQIGKLKLKLNTKILVNPYIKSKIADCQEFKMKIDKCSVNEQLEDGPQECMKYVEDIIGVDQENVDYPDEESLDSSVEILGSKDSLECQDSGYCHMTNLENHVMAAHNTENEYSTYNNIPSSNSTSNRSENTLKYNINRKYKRGEIYKYKHCDFGSSLLSNLKSHTNSKHKKANKHKCQYCDYESTTDPNLKIHINAKHTRENIYKCQFCDYESATVSNLKLHVNSKHTRENIHKCQYCDYKSPNVFGLKRHINTKHTRENIFKCQFCDYESTRESNLKTHINAKHTRENIYRVSFAIMKALWYQL